LYEIPIPQRRASPLSLFFSSCNNIPRFFPFTNEKTEFFLIFYNRLDLSDKQKKTKESSKHLFQYDRIRLHFIKPENRKTIRKEKDPEAGSSGARLILFDPIQRTGRREKTSSYLLTRQEEKRYI